MMKRMVFLLVFLVSALLVFAPYVQASASPTPPQPNGFWSTIRAYQVAWAFNDPPLVPHYGAWFSGSNGYNQHYFGPGGDNATCLYSGSGCISTWNWWGPNYAVLLLPKCWLFSYFCVSGQIPERWNAFYYQATMWIN
jgi:hypothetical protein